MNAYAARRLDAAQHRPVSRGADDELLLAVDIVEKHAERAQALLQTALEARPVATGDEPGQQTKRKDLLGPARVAVHRERDALLEQRVLGECLRARQLFFAERIEQLRDALK